MSLKSELQKRAEQLEGRLMSINAYLQNDKSFLGKAQYTSEDILKTEKQIEETKAAIAGIREWEKDERNLKLMDEL